MNNLAEIQKDRLNEMHARQDRLVKVWSPYIDAVDRYLKEKQDRTLGIIERRTIAQCLDNALIQDMIMKQQGSMMGLSEATQMQHISFLGIQLPVIAALLPSLVLNKIATIQALDRRQGAVFYLKVKYGSNKGSVVAGTTMMSPTTGRAGRATTTLTDEAQRMYASEWVYNEALEGSALVESSGGLTTISGTLNFAPGVDITNFVVTVTNASGTVLGCTTPGSGTLTGSGISSGTVTAAGAYDITFSSALDSDGAYITYRYEYDKPYDSECCDYIGVPQADIEVESELINAINFPLRAKYSMGASIDLEKAHGINLESEIVKYLGGDIKFTIDHYGIDLMERAATGAVNPATGTAYAPATAIGNWSATVASGAEWLWKKHEFLDLIEKGSNAIFAQTLRGIGNFLVVGNNVARLIRQFGKDFFTPAAGLDKAVPTGPIELGSFSGRLVIQDPFLTTSRYIMGFKGDSYLYSSFIYAPYIPMFATPTLLTSDLFAQKGFMSAAGFKIINAGLFTFGSVTNLPGG